MAVLHRAHTSGFCSTCSSFRTHSVALLLSLSAAAFSVLGIWSVGTLVKRQAAWANGVPMISWIINFSVPEKTHARQPVPVQFNSTGVDKFCNGKRRPRRRGALQLPPRRGGPPSLVFDLTMTHDRFGSSSHVKQ